MDTEKPNSAKAVRNTLTIVTPLVLNVLINLSDKKLEQMVPPAIIIEIMPAAAIGAPNSKRIDGQAEPNKESGKPRLIKIR